MKTKSTYAAERRKNSRKQMADFWRRLRKNKSAVVGLIILALLLLMAIFADVIVPYEMVTWQTPADRLQGPSAQHFFGTDTYGRDLFARVVHGSRISLSIGIAAAAIALLVGGFLGASVAYYGGLYDSIVMRIMDMFLAIPATLMALSIVAALGVSMVNLLIAIAITSIPKFVRLIRSAILPEIGKDYVEAARACGTSDMKIIFKHILPNAIGPIIVNTTQNISSMILEAASLSYIGLGVQPPTPEWGSMLSEAREFMRTTPHLIIIPGLFIVFSALSFNLFGDGLRDALDPRLKD